MFIVYQAEHTQEGKVSQNNFSVLISLAALKNFAIFFKIVCLEWLYSKSDLKLGFSTWLDSTCKLSEPSVQPVAFDSALRFLHDDMCM